MRFDSYTYLWPPRPEQAVQRQMMGFYQQRGFVAQAKMNGTCNVLAVSPDKHIVAMSRHNAPHKLWTPTSKSSAAFAALPGKGWYVFVAELMHSKVPGIKDVNYVNDVLVADGEYLVGTNFMDRYKRLKSLFLRGGEGETRSHHVINANTWLAKTYMGGNFGMLFDALDRPEIEGLVLKNPEATLAMCLKPAANSHWQVKIRRQTKNYGF